MKIFEGLSEHEEGAIRHTTLCVKYDEDRVIFSEGQKSRGMYIILEGAVAHMLIHLLITLEKRQV